MGRLIRKKAVKKIKKKNKSVDIDSGQNQGSDSSDKKSKSIAGYSSAQKGKKKGSGSGVVQKLPGNNYIDKAIQFLREVKIELKKVAWPARKQTIGSTIVVIILVFIISSFLGVVDFGLSNIVRVVLR